MNDALAEVVKAQRDKTPFCDRFIEFLQAGLSLEVIDEVNYNIIAWQEQKEVLMTDRHYEHYYPEKDISKERFETNEAAIMQNKSDAAVLDKMAVFKEENSLDMGEGAQEWFDYVTKGVSRE